MPAKAKASRGGKRKTKGRGKNKIDEEQVPVVSDHDAVVDEPFEHVEEATETVAALATASTAPVKQPKEKRRRTLKDSKEWLRAYNTIPEIRDNQDELANWIQRNDCLYNSSNRDSKNKVKKKALFAEKADALRDVTPDLCGKLSLF